MSLNDEERYQVVTYRLEKAANTFRDAEKVMVDALARQAIKNDLLDKYDQ